MNIPAKKSLGQNFLKSQEAIRDIIKAAEIQDTDTILEIGPGKGVLTEKLVEHAQKVVCIEKDDRLIELLHEKFTEAIQNKKLEIKAGDILEVDLETLSLSNHSYKVVANIPYYITGILIRQFLENAIQPSHMVLMLQKEVAQRIVARDNKESILSISVKAYGTPKYISTVKAKYFSPQPKVDSAIISISSLSKKFFTEFSEQHFFTIVKTGFAHKRKMLIGNLKELYSTEQLENAFLDTGIEKTVRAEDISLEHWKKLCLSLNR